MKSMKVSVEIPDYTNNYTGTTTERNLWEALVAESIARNKYTYYAAVAKKQGYEQMAAIFLKIANNEKEHAKIWFKELKQLKGINDNLYNAVYAEDMEGSRTYRRMAAEAREDGFDELAGLFSKVGDIEMMHEQQFRDIINALESGETFKRSNIVIWECRNCGYIHMAQSSPAVCPVCGHPQAYFQISDIRCESQL